MKRVLLVLVAMGLAVEGTAAAAISTPFSVSAGATSATVSGHGDGECATIVEVRDAATDGDLYDQTNSGLGSGEFSTTFTGLTPGTEYNVSVRSNCSEGDLWDSSFTTPTNAPAPKPQGPDRYIYCAVAGNTWLDGTAISPGTSLNLPADQANSDSHYKGATIGFWVPGVGATCSLTPSQAALAGASTKKVNHVGATGDYNQPEVYTLVG